MLQFSREQYFDALFEKNAAIKLIIDPADGTIVDANPAAAAFYGYDREQLQTMRIFDLNLLPEEEVMQRMSNARSMIQTEFTFPHKLASGEIRTVQVFSGPFEDNGVPYLLSIVHDVSEVHETQRALDHLETRFRAIANYTFDWESWVDSDGRLQWVNPAVERLTGQTVAECMAMPNYPFPFIHPDDRARFKEIWEDARAGGSGNDAAFRILRDDGEVLWVAMSWQPIRDDDGSSMGFRSSVRDVSERQRHAEEREELLRKLQAAHETVKRLEGLLPICAGCKKIRNTKDEWQEVEVYVSEHSDAVFSHSLCPVCLKIYSS